MPTQECFIDLRQILEGLLSALQVHLNHPSSHQLRMVTQLYLFAFYLDNAIDRVTTSSYQRASLRTVPTTRELKIETFSGRQQLQPDVTSSFVGYCACSCSPPCRRGPDVKLVCLALWRKREYLTVISIGFVAFSNQHFADYRS